ncbi:MAG: type II secretion system F family protein [Actinobacteria bacterium]|nr:type II secretion system F family protein [Actinomycetota bacterium]
MNIMFLASVVAALSGLTVALVVGVGSRRAVGDAAAAYLRDLDNDGGDDADEFTKRLSQPFRSRIVAPLAESAMGLTRRFTPQHRVEAVHQRLLVAGLSATMRAEEFVMLQAALAGGSVLLSILMVRLMRPTLSMGLMLVLLLVVAGALGPFAWLRRKADERQDAILRDLPDVLDLLAISVEAGVGFEGALDVVCNHFNSPLAAEFALTLKEMELGLSRSDALRNLKRRTEVPELSSFVLAIVQADALGMPLGRVLHTQATEQRNQRRQRAREKAGKLPVKIMFPLVLFIFPSILVVILGPAAMSVSSQLKL